jgi:DNA-binding beta-propeller fold protein YncE
MTLERIGEIPLPAHHAPGGFDHAAGHGARREMYVAHTANDALDVIDGSALKYLRSLPGLEGVAGALVSEEHDLVFTSTAGLTKVAVGVKPNGLAYDPGRGLLLAANVGDPSRPGSFTVSMVDVRARAMIADIPVAGRTRWTVFDAQAGCFYVNIAEPAQIAIVESASPGRVAGAFPVAAVGPHGLDLDAATRRLFCACDGGALVALDAGTGIELARAELAGSPDVIFFNRARRHLYVAIGDPGSIEVFETDGLRRIEQIRTEPGAHTLGFDQTHDTVYAFLPESHRALVFRDRG